MNQGNDPRSERYHPWLDYIYLWVCTMPGGTRVKVGITNNPDRRAKEFRTNSPFPGTAWFVCQAPDRQQAYEVEQEILRTFRAFRAHGEWVAVPAGKTDAFVLACSSIARRLIGPDVRFRDHRPRQPNGNRRGRPRKHNFG